jgi:osmoprotectant transport system substrate-binding protein
LISALGLYVLEDDLHYFPPYEAVPIVREQTLWEYPALLAALEELAGKVSEDDMRKMNYALDGQHRDVKEVVEEFRKRKGL